LESPAIAVNNLQLSGVVYTSIFNPYDGRKNWEEMVLAFCSALSEHRDATLVLKFVHADCSDAMDNKLPPFDCRVVAMDGFVDEQTYRQLISASAFAVNSSLGEGQCLPLMQFMSCGRPAIAPQHTALKEYIDEQVAFIVRSSTELCCWPHDPRQVFRARRFRTDWQSLVAAYRDSYRVAEHEPDRYAAMSRAATARLRAFCSEETVHQRLHQFIDEVCRRSVRAGVTGSKARCEPVHPAAVPPMTRKFNTGAESPQQAVYVRPA
jgi:glycosyltransferase involved in cell wall biosynthesis